MAKTKPSYRVMQISELDPTKDNEAWSAKIDGAHTIINMDEGKLPVHYSHRISKKTNEPIEYTAKLQHIKTPANFNAVIRGETYATTREGIAVHPDVVTALLNSGLEKSLAMQKNLGIKTQTALIDVDKFAGKDMRKASYAEKRAVLERIAESNPDYHLPDTAYDAESKKKLLKSVLDKKHHQTKEGLVVHDLAQPDRPFTKAKVIDHHDVYITGIFHEEGVKEGRKPMAGGFTYAWSPNGKTVGKVGTGFNHKEKVDMMSNPSDYIGRVAKVKALDVSKNKVLVKPSFDGWHVEKNLKEALSACEDIEKLAMARWRKFLDASKTPLELRRRLGGMMRNQTGDISMVRMRLKHPNTYSDLLEEKDDLLTLKSKAKQLFSANDKALNERSEYFQGKKPKDFLKRKALMKRRKSNAAREPLGGEEYIDIIHGSEEGRIKSFIDGGNSSYPVPPMNVNGTTSTKGIFAHSKLSERAPSYAYRASAPRGGEPAIMTGRIKKKYVYRNNDFSGGGDEILIPKEHYDKIENTKIINTQHPEWPDKNHVKNRIGETPVKYKGKEALSASEYIEKEAREMEKLAELSFLKSDHVEYLNNPDTWLDDYTGGEDYENAYREGEGLPLIPTHIKPFAYDGSGNHWALNARTGIVLSFDHEDPGEEEDYLYHDTGLNLDDFFDREKADDEELNFDRNVYPQTKSEVDNTKFDSTLINKYVPLDQQKELVRNGRIAGAVTGALLGTTIGASAYGSAMQELGQRLRFMPALKTGALAGAGFGLLGLGFGKTMVKPKIEEIARANMLQDLLKERRASAAIDEAFEKLANEFAPYENFLREYHDGDYRSPDEIRDIDNSVREGEGWPLIPDHIKPFMEDYGGNHYALNTRTGEVLSFDHEVHGPDETHLYHGTDQNLDDFMDEFMYDYHDRKQDNFTASEHGPYNPSLKGLTIGAGLGAVAGAVGAGMLARKYIPAVHDAVPSAATFGLFGGLFGGAKLGDSIDNAIFNFRHRNASDTIDDAFEKQASRAWKKIFPKLSEVAQNKLIGKGILNHEKEVAGLNKGTDAILKKYHAKRTSSDKEFYNHYVKTMNNGLDKARKTGEPIELPVQKKELITNSMKNNRNYAGMLNPNDSKGHMVLTKHPKWENLNIKRDKTKKYVDAIFSRHEADEIRYGAQHIKKGDAGKHMVTSHISPKVISRESQNASIAPKATQRFLKAIRVKSTDDEGLKALGSTYGKSTKYDKHIEKKLDKVKRDYAKEASTFIDEAFEKLASFLAPMQSGVKRAMGGLTTKRVMSVAPIKPKVVQSAKPFGAMKKTASPVLTTMKTSKKFLIGPSLKNISERAKKIDARKVVGKPIPGVEYNLDAIAKGTARGDIAKIKNRILKEV